MAINDGLTDKEVDNEDSIILNIRDKLKSMDIDYNALSEKIKDYLYKIESIINTKTVIQKEALEIIKNTTFNLNLIADTMGISRTTLYNNKVLELYIKDSKEAFDQNNPYVAFDKSKASRTELERQIDALVTRDIELEIFKQEISKLNEKLAQQNKENQEVKERRMQISHEKKELEKELNQLKNSLKNETFSKVTPINIK